MSTSHEDVVALTCWTYHEAFASAFHEACKTKGWSQQRTAEALGCTQPSVCRYWKGVTAPDIVMLRVAFAPEEISNMLLAADALCPPPKPEPRIRRRRTRKRSRRQT